MLHETNCKNIKKLFGAVFSIRYVPNSVQKYGEPQLNIYLHLYVLRETSSQLKLLANIKNFFLFLFT